MASEAEQPAVVAEPKSLWTRLVRPIFINVQFSLSNADGVALLCWTYNIITKEEYEHLKKETDRNRHNHYLVTALCKNKSDESFFMYVRILQSVLEGRRYTKIVKLLKEVYLKETGTHMPV